MKKKLLVGLLAIFMCFTLTGCGEENTNNGGNINQGGNEQQGSNQNDVQLYSDDTKLVFNYNDSYSMVYYFSGEKITGLEFYYNYENIETAAYAKSMLESEYTDDDDVQSVTQNGKYLVVKFKPSAYEDMTTTTVKQLYSAYEQVLNDEE